MQFIPNKKIFDRFPGFVAGTLTASNINNAAETPVPLEFLDQVKDKIKAQFPGPEAVGQHPLIKAWREAYKKFGADPHKYRCSSEALVRQVLKGNSVWGINPAVDIYNYISLKYTLPVGGEDIDAIQSNLLLDFSDGSEPFVRLGGSENEPPFAGEIVYKDAAGVICRMWNWREGDRTKLTRATKNAFIVIDALPPAEAPLVEQALKEMADLIQKYCAGESRWGIVTQNNSELTIV